MLIDPLAVHSVGTLLSFLAVATIVASSGPPEAPAQLDPLDELTGSRWARLVVAIRNFLGRIGRFMRMSFWIGVIGAPIVWQSFHVVSPISVLANLILWLPVSAALICGLLTAFAGSLFSPLGFVFGVVTEKSLEMITQVVEQLADIS